MRIKYSRGDWKFAEKFINYFHRRDFSILFAFWLSLIELIKLDKPNKIAPDKIGFKSAGRTKTFFQEFSPKSWSKFLKNFSNRFRIELACFIICDKAAFICFALRLEAWISHSFFMDDFLTAAIHSKTTLRGIFRIFSIYPSRHTTPFQRL